MEDVVVVAQKFLRPTIAGSKVKDLQLNTRT